MPKLRTGSVRWSVDHWVVRISVGGGKKSKPIHLPPTTTEAEARAIAADLSAKAKRGDVVLAESAAPTETVHSWFSRWFDHRKRTGHASADKDRGRFNKWAGPIAKLAMSDVTTAHLEALVESLDEAAQRYARAEKRGERPKQENSLSWKSAINTWTVIRCGFKDAFNSKTKSLRCIKADPAAHVRGPEVGTRKIRSCVSPDRFIAFVNREDIPREWRRTVTLAIYTLVRASELRGVRGEDIHTKDFYIDIHRTVDDAGADGSTKVDVGRRIPIEPTLVPLLEAMEVAPHEQAFPLPDDKHMARGLRRWLERAGFDDADLTKTATRAALTWHDLRGTGVTWRAIRGDDPIHIMAAAGHEDFKTTQKYIRQAAVLQRGWTNVFPELPASLLVRTRDGTRRQVRYKKTAKSDAYESGRWDLNPSTEPAPGEVRAGFREVNAREDGRNTSVLRRVSNPVSNGSAAERARQDELLGLLDDAWAVAEGRTKIRRERRAGVVEAKLAKAAALIVGDE